MNPLAGICLKNGVKVTGSDKAFGENQAQLQALGADIWTPHSLEELNKRELPDCCVYSTAIPENNPEYAYLKDKGVKFWHRSDLLHEIACQFEQQIVISGTHGKTTTTAMLIWMLESMGLKPCWVLGGVLKGLGSYAWNDAQNRVFVFEGDESDQSFLKSEPHIGLVTSLEPDHLENYHNSFSEQINKFQEFARKSKTFICNLDCANSVKHLKAMANISYSLQPSSGADWHLTDDLNYFCSSHKPAKLGPIQLRNAFGQHNVLNALGALAIFAQIFPEIRLEEVIERLNHFPGIYRRFELIGSTCSEICVIDDYAHHPTEVKAAIKAGRRLLNDSKQEGRLIVAFQPHLPTRLRDLWTEFTQCFEEADMLFLNDLYVARGQPLEGINSQRLAKEIKHNDITYVSGPPINLVDSLSKTAKPGDLILLLGAGDITSIRETLLEHLRLEEINLLATHLKQKK